VNYEMNEVDIFEFSLKKYSMAVPKKNFMMMAQWAET
jgi:hypothetical protein